MCAASTWSSETAVSTPALTNFRDEWRDLLESYDDIFSLYQSPEWFNHMRAGQNGWQHSLATRRDVRAFFGDCAVLYHPESVSFPDGPRSQLHHGLLEGGHAHERAALDAASRIHVRRHVYFIRSAIAATTRPDRLHITTRESDHYLYSSDRIRERYFVYDDPGLKQIHTIRLTATYEQFLAQYSGKKRYNLRRQLQLLREHTDGRLRLRRCELREDAQALIDSELEIGRAAGNKIFRHSDQIRGRCIYR